MNRDGGAVEGLARSGRSQDAVTLLQTRLSGDEATLNLNEVTIISPSTTSRHRFVRSYVALVETSMSKSSATR